MIKEMFEKLSTFAHHHQVLFLLLMGFSIVCASWAVEKILENFVFTSNSFFGYLGAVAGSLSLIWLIKRHILRDTDIEGMR